MKSQVFRNVKFVKFSGGDPNGYHLDKEDFAGGEIVLTDGRIFSISSCSHCGTLGVYEEKKKK